MMILIEIKHTEILNSNILIYIYNIKTGTTKQMTKDDFYHAPSMFGDYMVAIHTPLNRDSYSEVVLFNLNTGDEKSIINENSPIEKADIAKSIYRDRPVINENLACFRNYQFHLTVIELRISLKCGYIKDYITCIGLKAVSYTHLRAHETRHDLVCRLLLEKKKKKKTKQP